MNAAEQAATAYCSVLFADLDERLDGYELTILTLPDRKVRWLSDLGPAVIASAIREADTRVGVESVYLSMGLARPGTPHTKPDGKTRRMENPDIGALTHVWVDIDIEGPGHEGGKRLAPDEASVLRILTECGLPPTMVVRTGGGIHAYWKLAEPIVFDDEPDPAKAAAHAAALVRNWQLTLTLVAHRLGRWHVDSTHDFSRVLRAAGTTNRKVPDNPRRVEVVTIDETAVYEIADIEAHTAEQEYLDQFVGMADWKGADAVKPQVLMAIWKMVNSAEYRARGYMPEWLDYALDEGVLSRSDPFMKVWHNGHPSGDDSRTDASLARRVADLDMDERDAVEIIMCRRLRTGAKLDKVDPHRRLDYVQRTVGGAFASAKAAREEREAKADAGRAAVAAQDAAAAREADTTPQVNPVDRAATARSGARELGGAIAAELDQRATLVRPDPAPVGADPTERAPELESEPEPPTEVEDSPPVVEDEPPTGTPPPDELGEDAPLTAPDESVVDDPADEPVSAPVEEPQPDEPAPAAPGPEAPPVRPVTGPARSVWGTRTQTQHDELEALSKTLLGSRAEHVQIWRCQYRGRGAKQERRIVVRVATGYRWVGVPPESFVPGQPLTSGWWPSATFDKLGGWLKVLRQDLMLITEPVKGEDFSARFGDSLVRIWEPDTSGGSLANITRDGLLTYLLDFPPVTSWTDAVAQGMPLIIQDEPRWRLETPFKVLVRWGDLGRHIRTQFAINVTPPVLAEMAELAGCPVAPTQTQDGRWRMVRRSYLSDEEWRAVLYSAAVAEQQQEDRHGMRVVPGGRADDPPTSGSERTRGAR